MTRPRTRPAVRSVRFHPEARRQLFELYDYIAADAGRARARDVIDRIEASCHRLAAFPAMGRAAEELGPGLRLFPIQRRAVIVYRATGQTVDLLGVYYGGRDVAALMLDAGDAADGDP